MKTVTLNEVKITEIIIRPDWETPIVVRYCVIDVSGKPFLHESEHIAYKSLTPKTQEAVDLFIKKLLNKVETKEGVAQP